jgi:hypothetical protein
MNSKVEGVTLALYNYEGKRPDQDGAYFFLSQKLIKELFETSKV